MTAAGIALALDQTGTIQIALEMAQKAALPAIAESLQVEAA